MKIWAVEEEGKLVDVFVKEEDARGFVAESVGSDYNAVPYTVERRLCSVEECNEDRVVWGYCSKHYQRVKKHGDPHVVKGHKYNQKRRGIEPCLIHGCTNKYHNKGVCIGHYVLLRNKGEEFSQKGFNRVYEKSPRKDRFTVEPYYGG